MARRQIDARLTASYITTTCNSSIAAIESACGGQRENGTERRNAGTSERAISAASSRYSANFNLRSAVFKGS